MIHRCCLCRSTTRLQPVPLDSALHDDHTPRQWCTDRDACRQRVRDIVAANVGLGEMCQ